MFQTYRFVQAQTLFKRYLNIIKFQSDLGLGQQDFVHKYKSFIQSVIVNVYNNILITKTVLQRLRRRKHETFRKEFTDIHLFLLFFIFFLSFLASQRVFPPDVALYLLLRHMRISETFIKSLKFTLLSNTHAFFNN